MFFLADTKGHCMFDTNSTNALLGRSKFRRSTNRSVKAVPGLFHHEVSTLSLPYPRRNVLVSINERM